ncbi:SidE-like protein [Legionella waltersii]|uniref:SidE-like protein n=2 Tax=Legionella waltersii TaxID=66969 RepID=A0A0W1A010_9GAMM|nr:SidE-like protein [Legionella waltersii]SNV09206.1 Similar to Sid proteins [Legionella waltersii]
MPSSKDKNPNINKIFKAIKDKIQTEVEDKLRREEARDKLRKDIEGLIAAQYTLSPQKFAEEEIAVKQAIEKLVLVLSQPPNQRSLLAEIPMDSIENMTKRGHLTVIAKQLDENFLIGIEKILKNSDFEMTANGETIALSDLYNQCKTELTKNGKEPNFEDVLLRMYSKESPFYKKLNAIVGAYNDPSSTSDEERKMAFLLNIAIHKAGLMKREVEVHKTPDFLYRGQSFGSPIFKQKFARVQDLQKKGQLASLAPEQLVEINIVDIIAKKNVSMTSNIDIAKGFAGNGGVVLHVCNPEQLADYYAVANVSALPNEAEFMSRIPDDVAMIPIEIIEIQGIYHIQVMCIHSQNTQLYQSTRLHDLRNSLKNYVDKEINEPLYGFFNSSMKNSDNFDSFGTPIQDLYSREYTQQQKKLMKELMSAIEESEKHPLVDIAKQNEFLEKTIKILKNLYETNPTAKQKQELDNINAMFQDFSAAATNLSVTHKMASPNEIIASEQRKMDKNLQGKRLWLAGMTSEAERKLIEPLRKDMDALLLVNASLAEKKKAANNILDVLKANPGIGAYFKVLEESIKNVIKSADMIEKQEQILIRNASSVVTLEGVLRKSF